MSFTQQMDVSIIIVNFNTCSLTLDCINSIIKESQGVTFEIIVVDNASSDESVPLIKRNFPTVKLIQNECNLGFGKANNIGARHATGDYLFLLNSDTLFINNALKVLLDFMQQDFNKSVGICGGNLFTKDLKPNHSYSVIYPSLLNIIVYRSRLFSISKKTDVFNFSGKNKDVAIIIGADLFIRRTLYEELNGFDDNFFMYVEDGDLCYRAKKAGYRIVSVPEAKIVHYQGKSSTTGSKLIMEVSSYIYYFKKHHKVFTVSVYKSIEFFFAACKFILFTIISKKEQKLAYLTLMKFLIRDSLP